MRLLVTGAAGFIGFWACRQLLEQGFAVTGLDNMNHYYDVSLKENRLAILAEYPEFSFIRADLADDAAMGKTFEQGGFERVLHLAAQAGVRYSLTNPKAYIDSNISGFFNVLEQCRQHGVKHLIFASSSSVYGLNAKMPYSAHDPADHPVSLYGASKKANELMAHAYSHLYGLPCTGLRFFTVYGPYGRPDMAMFRFTKAIFENQPIKVFNHGRMSRDFTYVEDIVEGTLRLLEQPPGHNQAWNPEQADPASSQAPYKIYNIGNNQPVGLLKFIEILEKAIGRPSIKELLPKQPGDVLSTYADVEDLFQAVGFAPKTSLEEGTAKFVSWYREYYKIDA